MSIFNYRTNIDIKSVNTEENQLILASQKFGTFFCIYLNLKKNNDELDSFEISFNVKTYRGCFPIGIDKVETETIIPGLIHIKIHINVSNTPYLKSHKVKLKKGDYLIFEREESKESNSSVFINENEYVNLNSQQQDGNKTQYQIEKEIVEKMIIELRSQKISFQNIANEISLGNRNNIVSSDLEFHLSAASESFCVIGFSKII